MQKDLEGAHGPKANSWSARAEEPSNREIQLLTNPEENALHEQKVIIGKVSTAKTALQVVACHPKVSLANTGSTLSKPVITLICNRALYRAVQIFGDLRRRPVIEKYFFMPEEVSTAPLDGEVTCRRWGKRLSSSSLVPACVSKPLVETL